MRRRFQNGTFVIEGSRFYSVFYADAENGKTIRVKQRIGGEGMSERAARREHARIMEEVNRKRGSLAPVSRSQTFEEAVKIWRKAVAPNLSPATLRQRESYLRTHILPRFGSRS